MQTINQQAIFTLSNAAHDFNFSFTPKLTAQIIELLDSGMCEPSMSYELADAIWQANKDVLADKFAEPVTVELDDWDSPSPLNIYNCSLEVHLSCTLKTNSFYGRSYKAKCDVYCMEGLDITLAQIEIQNTSQQELFHNIFMEYAMKMDVKTELYNLI